MPVSDLIQFVKNNFSINILLAQFQMSLSKCVDPVIEEAYKQGYGSYCIFWPLSNPNLPVITTGNLPTKKAKVIEIHYPDFIDLFIFYRRLPSQRRFERIFKIQIVWFQISLDLPCHLGNLWHYKYLHEYLLIKFVQ